METAYNSQHSVRVRFAPSPTGMLHIGGARTALFNYLFARHMGGTFLLRIEDTDRERSTPENTQIILNSLKWLDIKPDEAPVYQSQRLQLHRAAVEKLLDEGKAYHDDGAVRFKIPEGGTSWEDNVQGRITYKNEQLEDFVIRRSDGTPTYHLAVVVDDIDMAITHIIRGDDHINNTPKQILLYQALGAPLPAFAHVPLIHGADGKKLSKRHGSVSVTSYQESGFLPQALNNYLLRLGWAHKDEEILPRERAIELFTLGGIGRGAAVFDLEKLKWLNAHYMKTLPAHEVIEAMAPFWPAGVALGSQSQAWLAQGLPELTQRAKTLIELAETSAFYLKQAPFPFDEKAQKVLADGGKVHLNTLAQRFEQAVNWDEAALKAEVEAYCAQQNVKFGDAAQPVRAALTGTTQSPSVFGIMQILGKHETLARINAALSA